MAVRIADVQYLKSALKVEAGTHASCIDRHSLREARLNVRTGGDVASRAGGVVNQGISEVTSAETIRKIAAPSAGDAVEQDT
ncbi:hypothetical protein TNCV_2109281 [Trichonephila clavipes]|nr:hypothetical protein TNCV_2109281 [Trichonephila clavipes]